MGRVNRKIEMRVSVGSIRGGNQSQVVSTLTVLDGQPMLSHIGAGSEGHLTPQATITSVAIARP
jgi:hypothetical protein